MSVSTFGMYLSNARRGETQFVVQGLETRLSVCTVCTEHSSQMLNYASFCVRMFKLVRCICSFRRRRREGELVMVFACCL